MRDEKIVWPHGAKCSVMITINLNAELFWLQLDPTCYDKPKTLSMGQYGMTNGLGRVLNVLSDWNVRATFFVPGKIAELYPNKLRDIVSNGHEIACSGYNNINFGVASRSTQEQDIQKGIVALEKVSGVKPIGFRALAGELTNETLELVDKYGLKYSSDLSDDDRPYYRSLDNGKRLLEIPIHWALHDLPYFAFNYRPAFPTGQGRIANYVGVLSNWIEEFEGFYRYGLCYVLQLAPQTIGNPGRIRMLKEILNYINTKSDIWFATGEEMCKYMNEYYG